MGHPLLYLTSWCMIIPHFLAVYAFQGPLILQWSYVCGPSTSVWNHGTTAKLAMLSDRIMMAVGCIIDLYFMSTLALSQARFLIFLNTAAIAAYVAAKCITGGARAITKEGKGLTWADIHPYASACHVLAHAMVSLSHFTMLYYIHHNTSAQDTATARAERFASARCLVLAAGALPLVMYFMHIVNRLPDLAGAYHRVRVQSVFSRIRYLWVLMNALIWGLLIGIPCMFSILLAPIYGLPFAQRCIWQCAVIYFKILLWASAVSLEIIGLENLDPTQNYFFACNHVSSYDIPVIFAALPYWMISISKLAVAYVPIFGWLVWLGGSIFVQRSNHTKSVQSMKRGLESLRTHAKSVLLFPEGRRSDNRTLQDFKRGGFMLAIQSELPVVPVALVGTQKIVGRNFTMCIQPIRPTCVTVVISKPIETRSKCVQDKNDLANLVRTGLFGCARVFAYFILFLLSRYCLIFLYLDVLRVCSCLT